MAKQLFQLPLGEEDDDIREWLAQQESGKKAQAVKNAIRRFKSRDDTIQVIKSELRELRKDIEDLNRSIKKNR